MTDKRKPQPAAASPRVATPTVIEGAERRHAGADGIAVMLPADRTDIVSVGGMRPGRVYIVAPHEARRLVAVKGFAYASDHDAERAAAADLPSGQAPGPSEGGGPADDARRLDGSNTPRLED